jgi:hypothetical protein
LPPDFLSIVKILDAPFFALAALDFAYSPVLVIDPASGEVWGAPADLFAWLAAHPAVDAGEVTATTVDGRPAAQITIELDPPATQLSPQCGPQECVLWLTKSFFGFSLVADAPPTRLILVTVGSTDVLIALSAGAELLSEADAVLESVDFD